MSLIDQRLQGIMLEIEKHIKDGIDETNCLHYNGVYATFYREQKLFINVVEEYQKRQVLSELKIQALKDAIEIIIEDAHDGGWITKNIKMLESVIKEVES